MLRGSSATHHAPESMCGDARTDVRDKGKNRLGAERDALADAWESVAALVIPGADLPARAELRRVSLMLAPQA